MIRLRTIIWAMGIWTTAASTLLAGLPHLQCRCPDGRVKPFCLSILFPSACCDRSCCIAADSQSEHEIQQAGAAEKPCCCCQTSRPAERGEQLRSGECQKTLVKAPTASPSDIVRYSASAFVSLLPDGYGAVPFVIAQPESRPFVATSPWFLPSTDLVIALRHLLV